MNGKDSDLTMEMLARGVTRAASGAAKDIDAEQNDSILGLFLLFLETEIGFKLLLMIVPGTLSPLHPLFLPWGSSSSTGAGDSRETHLSGAPTDLGVPII